MSETNYNTVLLFFSGLHFGFIILHSLLYLITRKQDRHDSKLNISYSLLNLSFFLVILFKKLLFKEVDIIKILTTYSLVCSSAYFGYIFFKMNKYKLLIISVFCAISFCGTLAVFYNLALRLFYFSASLLAFVYIVLLIIIFVKSNNRKIDFYVCLIGFISIYAAFIIGGIFQGLGKEFPALISSTYSGVIVVCFSLYFSYSIFEKNRILKKRNEMLEKANKKLEETNTLLENANREIEKQKKATEIELIKRVRQIDEMNISKYNFKPRVREAILYSLQGLTDEVIAIKMDRSDSMVKKYLADAREIINEEGHELKTKNDLIYHFRKRSG